MVVKLPCQICNKALAHKLQALQCSNCHLWVHIKYSRINLRTYKYLQKCSSVWYYLKYYEDIIPFTTISNKKLHQTNYGCEIKSTAITKKVLRSQDLIYLLNNAIDNPISENNSAKYYELYVMNSHH